MPPPYTLDAITEIIKRNLGGGRVHVELMNEHYVRGIDAALKMLSRYRPEWGYQVIPVVYGGNKTLFTAKNLIGVIDVRFFHSNARFEEAPYYTRWTDRSMELADMKDTQRVFGDQPEWDVLREVNPVTEVEETYIYTHFTRSAFVDTFMHIPARACVQFTWHFDASNDPHVGVSRISYDMRQWVEDYATAHCRQILGQIRSKFSGVPGATDASLLPNDGRNQIEMAREDLERLEADMVKRQRQLPLIFD